MRSLTARGPKLEALLVSQLLTPGHFRFVSGSNRERIFLPGEAHFGHCSFSAGAINYCGVIARCLIERYKLGRSFGNFLFAPHEMHFYVRSRSVPAQLIFASRELLAIHFDVL